MHRSRLCFALVVLLFAVPSVAYSQATPQRYLVGFKREGMARLARGVDAVAKRELAAALGGTDIEAFTTIDAVAVTLDETSLASERLRFYGKTGVIDYIEPVTAVSAFASPNELFYNLLFLWGLHNVGQYGGVADVDIDAPEAWDIRTGSNVVVAVIDSGIDYAHLDLATNVWVNGAEIPGNGIDDDANGYVDDVHGYDFFNKDGDPKDDNFHGTHVAGIIAATGNNGTGVVGANWTLKVMGLKILDRTGAGDTADVVRAIEYAIRMKQRGHPIRVINGSFGGGDESEAVRQAILAANNAGIVYVAAAGNDGSDNDLKPVFPSNYNTPNMISVAALNRSGKLASFSNYGQSTVHIGAPGSHIWSTFLFNLYFFFDGTSMAAPYVAGVAALVAAENPTFTPAQIKSRILSRAKGLTATQGRLIVPGIVSAYHALADTPAPTLDTGPPQAGSAMSSSSMELAAKTFFGALDSDGDGVDDQQEIIDGTNRYDKGSFAFRLRSPAYTKYNTFFGTWNFLELQSTGHVSARVRVRVYDLAGIEKDRLEFSIPPGTQYDLNIHDLVALRDTYGLVRIDFNQDEGAALSGRMSQYLPNADGSYSFAFARELRNPSRGRSFASGNAFDPQGWGYLVPNWLEILNLEGIPRKFLHRLYNQGGTLVHQAEIEVPALGEVDVAAGHQFGPGVYLSEVIPQSSSTRYLAAVSRYSSNAKAPGTASFVSAFSLDARVGTGEQQLLPISNRTGGCWKQSNWVEVVNTKNREVSAGLVLRNGAGKQLAGYSITLAPYSQQHFQASGVLSPGQTGSAELLGNAADSLLAQSLVYFHDCADQSLQTAYVSPSRVPLRGSLFGSANTYLEMGNFLSILSVVDRKTGSSVEIFNGEELIDSIFTSSSQAAALVPLNERVPVNSYRPVRVQLNVGRRGYAENLRLREIGGRVDFAMPTAYQ